MTIARRLWPGAAMGYGHLLAFLFVVGFAALILGYYHDRYWWPPDDGTYAHIADRILDGEVLNRDIQDLHPGYVHFANALALWAFGDELVSQRYPLVALGLLQACLIFALSAPRGAVAAAVAAVSLTALSFVQFLNPSAHWYCLFLLIAVMCGLRWLPRGFRWRLEILGFLVVTLLLFRQLTGVIVAIGTITYLLCESEPEARHGHRLLARGLLGIMTLGLGGYLLAKADGMAWILFGIWPMGILIWACFSVRSGDREVLRLGLRFAAGGAVAALPLVLYHLAHGSMADWFDDTVITALSLTRLDFITEANFGWTLIGAPYRAITEPSLAAALNGLFWPALTLLALVNGFLVVRDLWRRGGDGPAFHPLPFLAVFYGVVSVHFQIPIYLFYTAGISLVAVLWMTGSTGSWRRHLPVAVALALSANGLYYQAAQPPRRGLSGMLQGTRIELVPTRGLDRVGLWIDAADFRLYRHLIEVIRREVAPDQTILAVPVNPELYFLSGRKNPFRFYNTAFGIRDDDALRRVLDWLRRAPPRLVFHRPGDKYNTARAKILMDFVRSRYDVIEKNTEFVIYRSRTGTD